MGSKMDGFRMELDEKMLATWCTCMPIRLGTDACHIGGDGWAITDASSSPLWWKTLRVWWGGLLELRAEEIVSLLKWTRLIYA